MFEEQTFENILDEVLDDAPEGVDTRPGSVFYDLVAGPCFKIAQYYADLKHAFELVFLVTAVDEYLDEKGREFGVQRNPARPALYQYIYEGSPPSIGERFFASGKYFKIIRKNNVLYLEAEIVGQSGNDITADTPAVPVSNINGLTTSKFGVLSEPGTEKEDNENYRKRIWEKIAGPAENGNRQHYKTWCEEDAGIGRARIIPLFAGENTVMGVLIGTDGTPAAQTVVDRVQAYIDPITQERTVEVDGEAFPSGDGLGNGVANIGAHFTAVPAKPIKITVSFTAELALGATEEQVKAEATAAIKAHLKSIALTTSDAETMVIRISTVGVLLYSLESIIDYDDLTFNGQSSNIEIPPNGVAVLEGVVLNALV